MLMCHPANVCCVVRCATHYSMSLHPPHTAHNVRSEPPSPAPHHALYVMRVHACVRECTDPVCSQPPRTTIGTPTYKHDYRAKATGRRCWDWTPRDMHTVLDCSGHRAVTQAHTMLTFNTVINKMLRGGGDPRIPD